MFTEMFLESDSNHTDCVRHSVGIIHQHVWPAYIECLLTVLSYYSSFQPLVSQLPFHLHQHHHQALSPFLYTHTRPLEMQDNDFMA